MTITLDLSEETALRARTFAQERGQNIDTLFADFVEGLATKTSSTPATEGEEPVKEALASLPESLRSKIGKFHSGGDKRRSENTGEAFADGMAQKRREGRL